MSPGNPAVDDIFQPPSLGAFRSVYNDKTVWLVLAIIFTVVSLVLIVIFLILRSRIHLAIELIEEGSKAVSTSFYIVGFPLLPFLCQALVFAWFCLVASFLASAGDRVFQVVEPCSACPGPAGQPYKAGQACDPASFPTCPACPAMKCVFNRFGPGSLENWFQVYNIFGLLWLLFFLEAFGEMVMAGVFARWYWTFDKTQDLPAWPVRSSLYQTCRYHLGTLAFGSLVLSFVRFVRMLIEAVEAKLKKYSEQYAAARVMLCLCKCCFMCLESCLQFLNRNAYIMTSIYGESFCSAASHSFSLLSRNLVRVVVLDKVTDFILFVGKLLVTSLATLLAILLLSTVPELNYQPVPIILAIFGSFSIATCFSSIYAMAVDTIFLCVLEDLELHDGSPDDPYFMDMDIQNIVAK
jgi:choline transporter-like protein 2/4/5